MGRHKKVKPDWGGNAGPGSVVTLQPGAQGAFNVTRNPDGTAAVSFILPSLSATDEAKLKGYVGRELCTIQVAEQPMVGMARDEATGQFAGTLRRKVAPAALKESVKARILRVEPKLDLEKLQATLDKFSQREMVALDYLGNPFNCKMTEEDVKHDLGFSENLWDKMTTDEEWIWCRGKLVDFHHGVAMKPKVLQLVVREMDALLSDKSRRDLIAKLCIEIAAKTSKATEEAPAVVNNLYQVMQDAEGVVVEPEKMDAVRAFAVAGLRAKRKEQEKAEKTASTEELINELMGGEAGAE